MSIHPITGAGPAIPGGSPYRFGKYTLLAKLAQGGMGEVFVALLSGAAGFEKLVVIKRILPHLAEDPRFIAMFLSEARLTASMSHPNIAQVFELGEIDGDYYLAMEYLEGVSLSRLLKKRVHRGLDLRVAGGIMVQALEGLQFAHRFRQPGKGLTGVVHRDMSPSNVFVTSAGMVKVLDFGVAKASHHPKTTVTGLKGKYPYMAPEQIRGLDVDGRSDLFSSGVVLFETLTGEPLFHRDNDFDTLQAIVNNERPRVSDLRPEVPLSLEEVVERSLRVKREERYASAREMAEAITRALAPLGGPATTGELAEVMRAECAQELEDERSRIDQASEYHANITQSGGDLPELNSRRARPVVETEIDLAMARRRTPPFSGAPTTLDTRSVTGVTSAVSELSGVIEPPRRRRLLIIALIATGVALAAGSVLVAMSDGGEEAGGPTAAAPVPSPTPTPVPSATPTPTPTPTPVPSATPTPTPTRTPVPTTDSADTVKVRKKPKQTGGKTPGFEAIPPPAPPGYFSIDTQPYSQVYIDGKPAGITPLARVPLRPGKHSIRAVTKSGAQKKFSVTVESGKNVAKRLTIEENR